VEYDEYRLALRSRRSSSTESENCLSTIERIGYLGRFRLW
jgi:hypothetical protein